MKIFRKLTSIVLAVGLALSSSAFADTVKIAFVDPLSGPFATTGTNGLTSWKYAAKYFNKKLGTNFEIVALDNKMSGKESIIQIEVAIDKGIRYIAQGNSSGIANAITDHIKKHNKRNPDKRVLFLNYSAVDPALTNDKCNFWHFRFDANADIKMDALTDVIAGMSDIKKIYLLGQDYSFGKAVAAAAVRNLEAKTSIEIVGNELHPIGDVKDFTPYARKILASEADAVITGNWGADMVNLGRAMADTGFSGPVFTYYGASDGVTGVLAEKGKNMIYHVSEGHYNPSPSSEFSAFMDGYNAEYPNNDFNQPRILNALGMLANAIDTAKDPNDVVAVAKALEGMEYDSMLGTKVFMRPQDHQAIQNVSIGMHTDDVKFDFDESGYGIKSFKKIEMAAMDSPTTCKMKRP